MKGLFIKDLKLISGQRNYCLLLVVIGAVIAFSRDVSFTTVYLSIMGSISALTTVSYDEFDNGFPFLFALPITRAKYVRSKYIFGMTVGVAFLIYGFAVNIVAGIVQNRLELGGIVASAVMTLPVVMVMVSLMLPFQLKFGAEKSRVVMLGVLGGIMAIGFAALELLRGMGIDLAEEITSIQMSEIVVMAIAWVAGLAILFISQAISVSIMNKKEIA